MNGNVWAAYVAVWAVVGVALAVPRPTEQHRKSYSYEPAATLKLNSHGKLKILQVSADGAIIAAMMPLPSIIISPASSRRQPRAAWWDWCWLANRVNSAASLWWP